MIRGRLITEFALSVVSVLGVVLTLGPMEASATSTKPIHFNEPIAIAVSDNHVWVVNAKGNSITEIDASSGAVLRVISGAADHFDEPTAIAIGGNHVWVVNAKGNSVTELNAENGTLMRVINAQA